MGPMKIYAVVVCSLSALIGVCFGEMKIPRSIFRMDELDEAILEAMKKEEPLVIVYTDPGTT